MQVPDLKGETKLTASAQRRGQHIEFKVSELTPGLRFVLHDVAVQNVQGGELEVQDGIATIFPSATAVTVELA